MVRFSALCALFLMILCGLAQASDFPANPPGPGTTLCEGVFRGRYFEAPGELTFQLDPVGYGGELRAIGWWRGGMWVGQGYCWQEGPFDARVDLYFPDSPAHRARIYVDGPWVVMEGRADRGYGFQTARPR